MYVLALFRSHRPRPKRILKRNVMNRYGLYNESQIHGTIIRHLPMKIRIRICWLFSCNFFFRLLMQKGKMKNWKMSNFPCRNDSNVNPSKNWKIFIFQNFISGNLSNWNPINAPLFPRMTPLFKTWLRVWPFLGSKISIQGWRKIS